MISIRRQGESGRLAVLAAVVLALVAGVGILAFNLNNTGTQAASTGTTMSLSINGETGKVSLSPSTEFTVVVSADSIPLPDGYFGIQAYIEFGETGLVGKENQVVTWPDCEGATTVRGPLSPPQSWESVGCLKWLLPPPEPVASFHKGSVFEFDLTCDESEATHTILLLAEGDPQASTSGSGFSLFPVGQAPADHVVPPTQTATPTGTPTGEPPPGQSKSLVADSIEVNCSIPATVTPTVTATWTETPVPPPGPLLTLNASVCAAVPDEAATPTPTPTPLPKPSKCAAPYFPGQEHVGQFQITVNANRIPTPDGYGGFQSQVLFDGIKYVRRTDCEDEVVWPDASDATCSRHDTQANHESRSASAIPFPTSEFVGPVVELDGYCDSEGLATLKVTKASETFPDGASYFDEDDAAIPVGGNEFDITSTLQINCVLQNPEMSLTAFGPNIVCDDEASPNSEDKVEKPAKCTAPFVPDDPLTPDVNEGEERSFTIAIDANAIPDGYGGFQTQTFFSGLTYVERPCSDEVIWRPADLNGFVCESRPPEDDGDLVRNIVVQSGEFPPFPASLYVGRLVEFQVYCPEANQFLVALPKVAGNNDFGGAFYDPDGADNTLQPIIGSRALDTDADGEKDPTDQIYGILDILRINCEAVPPAPTPTVTPTATLTGQVPPTATSTPCPGDPPVCPPTATPTVTDTPTKTPTPTVTDTPTVTPTPAPPDSINEEVAAGGTVRTGFFAEPGDPVETSVTLPVGGKVSIIEKLIVQPNPPGFSFFGQQVNISAPQGTAQLPLIIQFLLDESIIPEGITPQNLPIFKGGILVPDCLSPSGFADPNPCVLSRNTLTGPAEGDIQIIVHTSTASAWNFAQPAGAKPALGDVNGDGGVDPLDALLVLFHSSGIQDVPWPNVADVNGDGAIDPLDAQLILQLSAGLIGGFPAGSTSGGIFWSWLGL